MYGAIDEKDWNERSFLVIMAKTVTVACSEDVFMPSQSKKVRQVHRTSNIVWPAHKMYNQFGIA